MDAPVSVVQHLVTVLRLSAGTALEVFNGQGGRFSATLASIARRQAIIQLDQALAAQGESPLETHLGLVMSKGERFDIALQKATELGVTSVTPLISERCEVSLKAERREKKLQHWRGVLIAACEQAQRDYLPALHPVTPLTAWAAASQSALKLVLHTHATAFSEPPAAPESVSFLVGPEGGLSTSEINYASQQGFVAWQLGPRTLRTETAPLAALSILQYRYGDLAKE